MIFQGWLRSPGERHRGLSVAIDIEESGLTISTKDRELGSWASHQVSLDRGDGNVFLLRVDGEQWFFEAEEPMRVLFDGLPLLEQGRTQIPTTEQDEWAAASEVDSAWADGGWMPIDRERPPIDRVIGPELAVRAPPGDGGGTTQSRIPSTVWGLLTATLLFFSVMVGVVVGRFQADGQNLLTGATVLGALVIGFAWGRLLWLRANRRRTRGGASAPPAAPPVVAGDENGHHSDPLPALIPRHPASPSALRISGESRRANGASRTGGVKVRGDRDLLGVVLGDGFAVEMSEDRTRTISVEPAIDQDTPDDLKSIKGIGPAAEQILIDLGHNTFEDVALLTPDQIVEIQSHMKSFKNRIHSDGWCFSAAKLHRQKYGNFPALQRQPERGQPERGQSERGQPERSQPRTV